PFYKSWKNEYNNRLYRVSDLEYQALAVTDEKNYLLGTVVNKNYEIIELNDQWHLYYKNSKTLEDIAAELKEDGESVLATELEELIAEKNKMLNAFYHALNISGRDDFDDEDLKRLYDNLQERNSE